MKVKRATLAEFELFDTVAPGLEVDTNRINNYSIHIIIIIYSNHVCQDQMHRSIRY